MQKLIAISLLLLPIVAHAFKNEPDGFRGIAWDDDQILHAEYLEQTDQDGAYTTYKRNDDSMKIGGAELSSVSYGFKDGKFVMVIIRTEPGFNSALIDAFKEQFGSGKKANRYIDNYIWDGDKTKINLECNSVRSTCKATLLSTKGFNEYIATQKKKAKGAAADF
jgi:hypothetical protein